MENNWLDDFLRRMRDVSEGRLPITNNYSGLDFSKGSNNPEYLCDICIRKEEQQQEYTDKK